MGEDESSSVFRKFRELNQYYDDKTLNDILSDSELIAECDLEYMLKYYKKEPSEQEIDENKIDWYVTYINFVHRKTKDLWSQVHEDENVEGIEYHKLSRMEAYKIVLRYHKNEKKEI